MKKNIIIGIVALVVLVGGYCVFLGPNSIGSDEVKTQKVLNTSNSNNLTDLMIIDDEGNTSIDKIALNALLDVEDASLLTEKEIAGILYMLEEEKLAHDVYITLFEMWDMRAFDNISRAEQTHMNALYTLAGTYKIDVAFVNTTVGVFTNETLAGLYTDLTTQGSESLDAALRVGALIEELDIMDLQEYINQTNNANIIAVYENLQRGSRNHLRAFVKNITGEYKPVYLSEQEYTSIVISDTERGSGTGGGNEQSHR